MRKRSELRGYQDRVAEHLYEHAATFAIIKMGGGKTASALTAAQEMIRDAVIRHGLILAPKRVAELVWPDEIKKWEHTAGLKLAVLKGGPAERLRILKDAPGRHFTVCGIDNIQWLVEQLKVLPNSHPIFDLLILDETSRFKSPTSKRAKALFSLIPRFQNRWGLTGTPRPNSAMDLFTPVKLITGGRLWGKSFYQWRQTRFSVDWTGYKWTPLPGAEDRIQRELATVAITLADGDMPELPRLNVVIDEVELPDAARRVYRQMEAEMRATLANSENVIAVTDAVVTGKLAQIAQGFVYRGGGVDPDAGPRTVEHVHDAKFEWLVELVDALDGEPLIVVYEYLEDLRRIEERWPGVPVIGAGHGQVARAVTDWNDGKLPLLVLHAAAGGHGLNLQHGGSRMAWLAPGWSPELWDQTIARLYRPGQSAAQVTVNICVAKDTVDEIKRARVVDKLDRQDALEQWLKQNAAA